MTSQSSYGNTYAFGWHDNSSSITNGSAAFTGDLNMNGNNIINVTTISSGSTILEIDDSLTVNGDLVVDGTGSFSGPLDIQEYAYNSTGTLWLNDDVKVTGSLEMPLAEPTNTTNLLNITTISGVPTSSVGVSPGSMVFDDTNNDLYIYNGAAWVKYLDTTDTPAAPTLSNVLAAGNFSGPSDIAMQAGRKIEFSGGNLILSSAATKDILVGSATVTGGGVSRIVIGDTATANSVNPSGHNVSIGTDANSRANEGVAIGHSSRSGDGDVSVGPSAVARGPGSGRVVMGRQAEAGDDVVSTTDIVAIGKSAVGRTTRDVSIGGGASCTGTAAEARVAIGNGAQSGGVGMGGSIALGKAFALENNAIAVGTNSAITGPNSIGLGANTIVNHGNSVVIGTGSTSVENDEIRLGTGIQNVKIPGNLECAGFGMPKRRNGGQAKKTVPQNFGIPSVGVIHLQSTVWEDNYKATLSPVVELPNHRIRLRPNTYYHVIVNVLGVRTAGSSNLLIRINLKHYPGTGSAGIVAADQVNLGPSEHPFSATFSTYIKTGALGGQYVLAECDTSAGSGGNVQINEYILTAIE